MTDPIGRPRLCLATASPNPSGVGSHMLTLAAGLAGDADVTIAAPAGSALLARAAAAGLIVKAIDAHDEAGLARWFARAGFAVIHLHAGIGWEAHALARAARAGGGAVVRTEHLPYLLTCPVQQDEHRDGVAAVDRVVCVSDGVAESYRAAGLDPARLTVIANGVDAPPPPARARDVVRAEMGLADAPVLLIVGRLEAQKAHALMLDALPAVLARHPGATLFIAGDGPLLVPLARQVARRGLAGSVRMLGHVGDVATLMAAADLLVMPSHFEGLPLAVLEAMAAGLPVVATAAPGCVDAIDDGATGWLVPVGDASALAGAIVAAIDDPATRERVATAARAAWDAHYRADRMIGDTAALYATVTGERPLDQGNRVTPTRIAFIGAGGIAGRHFGVLEHFDDVRIDAVCDTDLARAEDAAARFGARAFDDADAMLDAVEVDAVYICVPPFAHGVPERAALRRGLPFFVEKPVALDLATAEAIADEVEETGTITAVGYHWRYLDNVDEIRGLLQHNPARMVSGYWLDSTPPPQWWWHQDRSGGQMVEQTTHLLDLSRFLLGDAVRAYGLAGHTERAQFPGLDVATVSTASVLFAGGAIGNFASTCLLGWNHRVGLHIFGENLAIELTDRDVMIDTGHGRPVHGNGSDPVWREDRDFIDAVRGGENRIRCPYREAVATHRLALAIGESARSGEAVNLAAAPAREPAHV